MCEMPKLPETLSAVDPIILALRPLAENAPLIVWECDAEGTCIYINPSAKKYLDFDALPGWDIRLWFELIHPEDAANTRDAFQRAWEQGNEFQGEYRIVRSDGSERWLLGTAAPSYSSGQFQGYQGTIIDVTERHSTQARLEQSEAELRLLAENASDLLSHFAPDGSFVYASPSHFAVLGYAPEELLHKNVRDLIHASSLTALLGNRAPLTFPSEPQQLTEIEIRHKAGHSVFLDANVKVLADPHTGELRGAVVVSRDVTEQRRIRLELARREAQFRALTSLSADWYWETDAEGRITFVSDGVRKWLGLSPEDMVGKTREELSFQQGEPGMADYAKHFAERTPFRDLLQTRVTLPSGEVRHTCLSGEPVFESGKFMGFHGVSRDVTEARKAEAQLHRMASYDHLTGLLNRMSLDKQLRMRLDDSRSCNPLAVFFIDLDRFKEVNDTLGHDAGDVLLQEIANRIKYVTREGDLCARLGGDEFVLVAECRRGAGAASFLAKKLCASLAEPMLIKGQEVQVGASIGISMYPTDGQTSEVLFQKADTALYDVKAAGRNNFQFFSPEMSVDTRAKMKLQVDLRRAQAQGQFELHYQPRLDLRTFHVVGIEALMRWRHPLHGDVSPSKFIPLAEDSGLIDELGAWALHQACAQAQAWNQAFRMGLKVSVNLSARQLRSKRLVATVADALRLSGLPATLLELELTESSLITDAPRAVGLLSDLKAMGVSLSVDDFGTGYSSLSHLRQFPIDTLKLDRSFLQEQPETVDPGRLAKGIIGLAHSLNLCVVAEGVETEQHLDLLRSAACDQVQGFSVSSPLAPAALEEYLTKAPAYARVMTSKHWKARSKLEKFKHARSQGKRLGGKARIR